MKKTLKNFNKSSITLPLKNKKGSSTIYELLISLVLLTFVVMFPISLFSYLHRINSINDIMGIAIQSMEQNGRFDSALYNTINSNLKAKGLPELGNITNSSATNQNSYLISNLAITEKTATSLKVVTKPGVEIVSSKVSMVTSDKANHTYNDSKYAMKYRNGFALVSGSGVGNVYYNMNCSCGNYNFYLTKNDVYRCPYCLNVMNLDMNTEAQVVSLTIYVPVTKQISSMAKLIQLLSLGAIDTTTIESYMGNIQKQVDGNYYFVKTYYGVAEPYYFVGNNTGVK